ncbi:recombinase family protein [Rhizobium leguminosarum]|uniref:recombinase family protein n=1 Tax=Rhizobium leguminosarum TaxID=384 RepID=UPI001FEEBEC8|nr:recombinase family protein [Rhizobium leguminosarum]
MEVRCVALRFVTEAIDTRNQHGAFLVSLFGSLAEYERALITERVNAGVVTRAGAAARAAGLRNCVSRQRGYATFEFAKGGETQGQGSQNDRQLLEIPGRAKTSTSRAPRTCPASASAPTPSAA